MTDSVVKSFLELAVTPASPVGDVPSEVTQAQSIDWGVTVDAYLANAARVGRSYAAHVYKDRSCASLNGMTVATPPLLFVEARGKFKLMRSLSGQDNYVIVSELNEHR